MLFWATWQTLNGSFNELFEGLNYAVKIVQQEPEEVPIGLQCTFCNEERER